MGALALAMLQAALVALPRGGAFAVLGRLRSPAWAALLPGAIVFGTFAPLWHKGFASALVLGAAITTPLMAVVTVVAVARARRALVIGLATALAVVAAVAPTTAPRLLLSVVTALGSLSVGVALTRLIPPRWLLIGVVVMAAVDAVFLLEGVGVSAAGSMASASAHFHGPQFTQASVGPTTVDYPDLVLASVLGGTVAGSGWQRRAALTLALLAGSTGLLLAVVPMVPETVPIAMTFGVLAVARRAALPWRRRSSGPLAYVRATLRRSALGVHCLPACRHLPHEPCPAGCS
jgi:hypothetical protein